MCHRSATPTWAKSRNSFHNTRETASSLVGSATEGFGNGLVAESWPGQIRLDLGASSLGSLPHNGIGRVTAGLSVRTLQSARRRFSRAKRRQQTAFSRAKRRQQSAETVSRPHGRQFTRAKRRQQTVVHVREPPSTIGQMGTTRGSRDAMSTFWRHSRTRQAASKRGRLLYEEDQEASAFSKLLTSFGVWPAVRLMRNRAVPGGTDGGRIAGTSKPSSSRASEKRTATCG